MNILEGRIIKEKRHSDINGELTVVQDLFMGTYILGGGLPQSGGLAKTIWKHTLNTISKDEFKPKNCLILGLGGGGLVSLLVEKYPDLKITGVDIDPVIVDLGKKYLKFENKNTNIVIEDAETYVNKYSAQGGPALGWDLVCVDTYVGDEFPEKFHNKNFVEKVKKLLSKNPPSASQNRRAGGMAIFNRLYGAEDRKLALEFGKTLESVFENVERVYPEANLMFKCY